MTASVIGYGQKKESKYDLGIEVSEEEKKGLQHSLGFILIGLIIRFIDQILSYFLPSQ